MKNNYTNAMRGYFDADWAENFDKKSIIDFYIFVGENLVTCGMIKCGNRISSHDIRH
jgi:hypothetical protein